MEILVTLAILVFSAIVHEVSHGLMAEKLGDSTARDEGRITLNPIPHIDPIGSIILPALLLWAHSPVIFGAAKPVPVNFNNLRNPKSGTALVSLAGPLSNFVLAILFVLPIKLGIVNHISEPILYKAILINLALGVLNLIPIPPLDGSKILASLGSRRFMQTIFAWENYGFIFIFLLIYSGILGYIFTPIIIIFFAVFGLDLSALSSF